MSQIKYTLISICLVFVPILLLGCSEDSNPTSVPTQNILHKDNRTPAQPETIVSYESLECYDPQWSPGYDSIYFKLYNPTLGKLNIVRMSFLGNSIKTDNVAGTGGTNSYSISPNGASLAFSRNDSLFVVPTTGGNGEFIVFSGCDPSWSPDGAKLVFTADSNEGGPSHLSIFDLKTNEASALTTGMFSDREPCWSNSGNIIFSSNRPMPDNAPGSGLWSVAVSNASEPDFIPFSAEGPAGYDPVLMEPDISPDGTITFVLGWGSGLFIWGMEIAFLPANGGDVYFHPKRLQGSTPVWSPDGRSILFSSFGNLGYRDIVLASPPAR